MIPSTIYWVDGTETVVYLSQTDTQKLVETFLNGTADIVNVENHPNGKYQKFFFHIRIEASSQFLKDLLKRNVGLENKPTILKERRSLYSSRVIAFSF